MRARFFLPLFLLALALVGPGCQGLQQRNNRLSGFDESAWNLLGQRRVRLEAESDVIPVTFLEGRYRRLMVVVHGSALEMYDMRVTFGNGETFSPLTRLHFSEDSRSRIIDLPGVRRTIRKVEFSYRSKNLLTGFAEVELWGKR